MWSPHIPAVHMNTRHIATTRSWFGGGADLTPMIINTEDKELFHNAFQSACTKHDDTYYTRFKEWCDDYFLIKHREETRGIGGIFFDYLYNDVDLVDFLVGHYVLILYRLITSSQVRFIKLLIKRNI